MRTAYLAARYSRRLELCGYRDQLAKFDVSVPARWLNGSHQLDDNGRPIGDNGEKLFEDGDQAADHYRTKLALDDYFDVQDANFLIAFTEVPRAAVAGASRGGRHVELGLALGMRKAVFVIGPRENVFCWLPGVTQFDTWQEFIELFAEEALPV